MIDCQRMGSSPCRIGREKFALGGTLWPHALRKLLGKLCTLAMLQARAAIGKCVPCHDLDPFFFLFFVLFQKYLLWCLFVNYFLFYLLLLFLLLLLLTFYFIFLFIYIILLYYFASLGLFVSMYVFSSSFEKCNRGRSTNLIY